jgi:serine/threonine protein kinase
MNPRDWHQCKRIFSDALELIHEERILLIDRECGGEPELRTQVLKMLAAAADDSSPLDVSAAERVVGRLRPAEPLMPGDIVDRYRVLRRLGQGGTSLVYLAEHVGLQSPRRFAIKVIHSAFFAGQHERFERECEILAAFDHPNIARIIDKGVTESGWPYLVMDYIDGAPIHQYCVEQKLAPPEIIRLVLDCCRAVQYIHSNLVVHCDLKPSNILVDTTGSPRILDFGVARLIEPGHRTRGGQTTRGIRPLTPNYASPEQLAGSPLTESTDIYSLGVVLYESLTGSLPCDNSDFPWTQIGARIAEQDPPLPSQARLSGTSSREDAIFARQLRGDLDSIVLKALAHDPAKRYLSMGDLIADLNRYLAGEVVQSRRSNWSHRVSKLLRRHRRSLAELLAVCCFIALTTGLLYAWHFERARETLLRDELRGMVGSLLPLPQDVPGSARERGMLFENFLLRIGSAWPNAAREPKMIPDLADALLKAADLRGNPYYVSLGHVDEARTYYHRAFDLVLGSTDARCIDIRARACLGLGDTYSHPALHRDPAEAAEWYRRALSEILPKIAEFPKTAALAYGRIGLVFQLMGGAEEARTRYREGLALLPREKDLKPPLDAALNLLVRGGMEPPEEQAATYSQAVESLDGLLPANTRNIRIWHAAIDAHLSLGLANLQFSRRSAESEFARAAGLAKLIVSRDPEDSQERGELAVALRRSALISAMEGKLNESDRLRGQATEELRRITIEAPASTRQEDRAGPSCPSMDEQFSEGNSLMALQAGDLLIGNRSSSGVPGALLVFSPGSHEMSVLSTGRYLSDMVDVASGSRTELYVAGRSRTGSGTIVRLRYDARDGRWLEKPITCGGLLQRPVAIAYRDKRLILADADGQSARLIGVDLVTGRQTLLGRTETLTEPGKIVYSAAGDYYLSLFWSGEGGPAEIVRLNPNTRKLSVAARYGLLDSPVALAMTPRGDLIAGNREWAANGGNGSIVRIDRRGVQKTVYRSPELSRVTAVAVASEREAWYATAAAPFSLAGLFKLDLVTGKSERIPIVGGLLGAPNALVYVN